jgi:hypothetical protein
MPALLTPVNLKADVHHPVAAPDADFFFIIAQFPSVSSAGVIYEMLFYTIAPPLI